MKVKLILGLAGVILLSIGFLLPVVTDVSSEFGAATLAYYKAIPGGMAIIISLLNLASLMLILIRKFGGLWFTGTIILFTLLLSIVSWGIDWMPAKEMETETHVIFHCGWGVLFAGAILIIASAAVRTKPANLSK